MNSKHEVKTCDKLAIGRKYGGVGRLRQSVDAGATIIPEGARAQA